MRAALAAALVLGACAHAPPRDPIARRVEPGASVVIVDVDTGDLVVRAGDVSRRILPLSIVKLYTAALWWDQGVEPDRTFDGDTVEDIVAHSIDRGGRELAIELRRSFGVGTVLAALAQDGVDVALPETADDARWGEALSIGERDLTTTLLLEARWLRTRARDPASAGRLFAAMRATVDRGSAREVRTRLDGTGWSLGGKTGTGPAWSQPYDGVFAGVAFEGSRPRYAIAVYEPGRGPGGGAAAALAADLVSILAARR